ncbi:hypothetical protein EDB81DRAFT_880742 [Dactylonectria macrodidyma]|uniref:C2H2-type domain-containing protein n=1 Tax=Dactylonectria macrodidyma TaxID=307937 RepID=A0A9P9JFS3_9HYPO|nr:hypothetical protein EDB81DRAFT_880742 [Dactylonectria macrodidyma]
MGKKSDGSSHKKRSGKSRQTEDDDIPIDPSLYDWQQQYAAYAASANAYPEVSEAGPSYQDDPEQQSDIQEYYNNLLNQPQATVDPSLLIYDPGPSSAAQYAPSYYYPNTDYDQSEPSSSSTAPNAYECPREDCPYSFPRKTELNKHIKTHDKPIKCSADPNCKTKKAEQRDMDRHYLTAHRAYAQSIGLSLDEYVCLVCRKTFTRLDNLQKHMKRTHSPNK